MILKICIVRLKYLQRPPQLERLTYPDFFRLWDLASSSQQQKASDAAAEGSTYCVSRQGSDDFASLKEGIDVGSSSVQLALSEHQCATAEDLLAEVDFCSWSQGCPLIIGLCP